MRIAAVERAGLGAGVALLLALATLAAPTATHAQRSLDVERFRPSPDGDGFLGVPSTRTPGHLMWTAGVYTTYASHLLMAQSLSDGSRVPIVRDRIGAELAFQLGLTDRLALVAHVPMVAWQNANAFTLDGGPAVARVALRDPYVATRITLLGETSNPDLERPEGEGLAVQLGSTVPVGLEDSFAGEGLPALEGLVLADFAFLDLAFGAFAGFRHRFAEPELLGYRFRNELLFGASARLPTLIIPQVSALVEVRVAAVLDDAPFDGRTTAVELDGGLRWRDGDLSLTAMAGAGLGTGVGAPGFRAMLGLAFAPRHRDTDGDGIEDRLDQCPHLPEDHDGFEDEDGCPDLDNDGDLVPDVDDRCPNEPAFPEEDEDGDGCPDPPARPRTRPRPVRVLPRPPPVEEVNGEESEEDDDEEDDDEEDDDEEDDDEEGDDGDEAGETDEPDDSPAEPPAGE